MSDAADRLQHLINTVHPPRRAPWTDAERAGETQQRDTPLSADDVQAFRTGTKPMDEAAMAQLADMFGVSPAYFTDPTVADETNHELAVIQVLAEFDASTMLCARPVGTAAGPKLADLDPEKLRAELLRLEQMRHERLQDTRDERVSRDGRTGRETRRAREPRASWWTRIIRNTNKHRDNAQHVKQGNTGNAEIQETRITRLPGDTLITRDTQSTRVVRVARENRETRVTRIECVWRGMRNMRTTSDKRDTRIRRIIRNTARSARRGRTRIAGPAPSLRAAEPTRPAGWRPSVPSSPPTSHEQSNPVIHAIHVNNGNT